MTKKHVLLLAVILLAALALSAYASVLPVSQAQSEGINFVLTISGLVSNPLNLTLSDLEAMPQITEYAALYCVDSPGTPLQEGNWTGVELSYLLQQANVSSSAVKVALFAPDGFTTDFDVNTALQNTQILVAYQKDNVSLGELQLVVPQHWGYKWITQPGQIEVVNYNFLGTYESQGYTDDGTITESGSGVPQFNNPGSSQTPPPNTPAPAPTATSAPTQQPTTPPTQSSEPSQTPTVNPTKPEVSPSIKPAPTLPFLVYVAAIIIAASAATSTIVLTKRTKQRTKHTNTL
jgi:DMSO/TMAO reductase YedYZ molybdopterin-dependent catalytic subunit